ncbi:MAG TPA: non-homologous end-joining DNA ligase [Gemmatimonadaceae bacterium]|nr:non-homologous end-joining DNA ligase [Gemmatimonadaceae bacterium]
MVKTTASRGDVPHAVRSGRGAARTSAVIAQLDEIEHNGGDGVLRVSRGRTLTVSRLDRVVFPEVGCTKGDVMRYYAHVAPFLLPRIKDRPLVLKRSPEGLSGETFFQQKAPSTVPRTVRVTAIMSESSGMQARIIGGDLATLLYTIQIGCISVDPWHSRVQSLDHADYAILDLDPGPDAAFAQVVQVARWIKEELDALDLHAAVKTSGSAGLHIVLPLPAGASYDTAVSLAGGIALSVARAHPDTATTERSLKARPDVAVYVDYLQNARGKSLAAAYCVRARPGATVSTPLDWQELTPTLSPARYTMATMHDRLATVGDLWGAAMRRRNTTRSVRAAIRRRG